MRVGQDPSCTLVNTQQKHCLNRPSPPQKKNNFASQNNLNTPQTHQKNTHKP